MSKTNKSVEAAANIIAGVLNDDVSRQASFSGALPVKITATAKFKQHTGYVTVSVDLPADPLRGDVALYTVQVTPGSSTAAFPVGASPLMRSATGIFNAHTDQGSTSDCWAVCEDKFFNPGSPTSTNATFLGRFTNAAGVISSGVNV